MKGQQLSSAELLTPWTLKTAGLDPCSSLILRAGLRGLVGHSIRVCRCQQSQELLVLAVVSVHVEYLAVYLPKAAHCLRIVLLLSRST